MILKKLAATTCVAAIAFAAAPAMAQNQAAAPQVNHGPPINGMCILSVEGAVASSTVGQHVNTRMQQIISQVNAELTAERTAIENEGKTLEGQRASMDQATLQRRATELQGKASAFGRKAAQREREIAETQQKALGRVGQELDPVIRQVYQQRQCSVLLNRDALVLANPAMDITPQVVTGLNAKITQFNFDRERLDQQQPAQTNR